MVGTFVEVETNRVVVELDPFSPSDQLSATAKVAFDEELIEARVVSEIPNAAVNLANDPNAPPVYGGHSWTKNSGAADEGFCTLGFEVNRSADNTTAYHLSAGHCVTASGMSTGSNVYHGGTRIGTIFATSMGGTKDFTLQKLVAHATTNDDVWYGTGPARKDVVGTNTSYAVGNIRCFTGKVSYTECGAINDDSWSGDVNVPGLGSVFFSDFVRHESAATPGDSGSPFYRYSGGVIYAAGILSATSSTDSLHAKWTQIPTNWGVTLETN